MSAPLLELDFGRARLRGGWRAVAIAAAGTACLLGALLQLHRLNEQRAGLEMRHAALLDAGQRAQSTPSFAGLEAQNAKKTERELATPWSQLLAELETASGDTSGNVALLSIEPDHAKHRVRVTAEARNLGLALAYVQRLRKAPVLRFPMLENHEMRSEDKDRPVRFQVSAEWRDGP